MHISKLKPLFKVVAFLLLFCVLLHGFQRLVTPRWDWPDETERRSHQVKGLYLEPADSLDVLFVGASHVHAAISPMEIYRQSGIWSYNIATSGQPMPLSCEWLKTALKRQSPKVVVLDAGGCYISEGKNAYRVFWYNILDTIPRSKVADRLNFVAAFNKLKNGLTSIEAFISDYLPVLRYHENFLLTENNFLDINDEYLYPRKGQVIYTAANAANVPDEDLYSGAAETLEEIPEDQLTSEQVRNRERYAHNEQYLDTILAMCKEHNCELVLTKVPVHEPNVSYDGSWSVDKHNLVQKYADEHGLKFVDLNYLDLGIDWRTETADNGKHLNGLGAKKVSRFFAQWLSDNYAFEHDKPAVEESWQAQLAVFDHEMNYYELQMEQNLEAYLDKLDGRDYTILAAISKNVGDYWTGDRQTQLDMLTGTHTDLFGELSEAEASYVVVGTGGTLLDEDLERKGKAKVEGTLPDGKAFKVVSSLEAATGETSISIDGREYSTAHNGLRFVIYDNELHCVVDAATIVVRNESYKIAHSSAFIEEMRRNLLDYEQDALKNL